MTEAHSELGASAAHRWLYCPGSVKAIRELGEDEVTTSFMAEGSLAHEIAERALITKSEISCDDEEMKEYVNAYVKYVIDIGGMQEYERKVDYSEWVPGGYGTADAICITNDTLHVIDLKYGRGVKVEAKENPQLKLYAIGALSERELLQHFNRVVVHICQPRLNHYDSWETAPEHLYEWAKWARERAKIALSDDPPRIPGETQCKWCKAKPTCSAVKNLAEHVLLTQFENISENGLPDQGDLSDEDIKFILIHRSLIIEWLDSIVELISKRILNGETFEGWKLVSGRATRKWADEKEAAELLEQLIGEKAWEKSLISVARAEKALGKEGKKQITGLITKKEGSPILVPESDKREAISNVSKEDFNF